MGKGNINKCHRCGIPIADIPIEPQSPEDVCAVVVRLDSGEEVLVCCDCDADDPILN